MLFFYIGLNFSKMKFKVGLARYSLGKFLSMGKVIGLTQAPLKKKKLKYTKKHSRALF